MAATVGKDGGVKVGASQVSFIDTWNLTATVDNDETTSYGDTYKKRVQTLKDWSAEVSGTLDRSDTQQAALLDQLEDGTLADVDLRLETERGSSYWSGSALIESWTITHNIGSKVGISFSFTGNGALSWTEA